MALNDTQVTNRLRPEFRQLYEGFRELGMDQAGALRAAAGRDKTPGDILISEAGGTVAAFQGLGLNLNEAEIASRGRPEQDHDLLRERRPDATGKPDRKPLSESKSSTVTGTGATTQSKADKSKQRESSGRRTVELRESAGRIEYIEGRR